jgi:hypothetical protein
VSAPDWLPDLLDQHVLGGFGCCSCGWLAENRFVSPHSKIESEHRRHISGIVWNEFHIRYTMYVAVSCDDDDFDW